MRTTRHEWVHGMIAVFLLGLGSAACEPSTGLGAEAQSGATPPIARYSIDDESPETRAAGTVRVSWYAPDDNGNVVLHEETITLEEKAAMHAAREAATNKASANGTVESSQSALTTYKRSGCDDDMTWLYSGTNRTGTIHCAATDGTWNGLRVAYTDFAVKSYWGSYTYQSVLCTGDWGNGCFSGRNGAGRGWGVTDYIPPNWVGNTSGAANIRYVSVEPNFFNIQ